MSTQLLKTVALLKKVIQNPLCSRMNLSNIKGYLGELWIMHLLVEAGQVPDHRGNQSGYDIEVGVHRIDVKTSTLKREVKGIPPYWGWALVHANKKKTLSCSHFVCIALNKNFDPIKLYIIDRSDIDKFPKSGIRQFKNVVKGFVVMPSHDDIRDIVDSTVRAFFVQCSSLITGKTVQVIDPEGKLLLKAL